ncbi:MAG: MOSC domain-containing protein [Dehalococcoidia bacterium]
MTAKDQALQNPAGDSDDFPAAGPITVTALYHYPIKSCAGRPLERAEFDRRGILHDRELMLVDSAGKCFLTQRELPRMALIRPRISETTLTVESVGMPPLIVPILPDGPQYPVTIWRDTCRAVDQGEAAAAWFAAFLGVDCRLVRLTDGFVRPVDPAYATDPADEVGFADGYPFLLLSEESLADLNRRLAEPLPVNRFRPNILVAGGGQPYLEDHVKTLRIGSVIFHVVKPCARCTIPTTDQETGARGKEPLATLATYRRAGNAVLFAQNLIHTAPGAIRVGDPVTVLA